MTDGRLARQDAEAMVVGDSDARLARQAAEVMVLPDPPPVQNSRESIEVLHSLVVTGLDARASFEALRQNIPDGYDARLSIEVLEGPIRNTASWGFITLQ